MIIYRYITRKFIRSLLIVLIAFLCLGYIQELATGAGATLEGEGSYTLERLLLILFFVPQFIFENLPMVFLLGSLHFSIFLLRSKEYLAIKTSGRKGQNITVVVMFVAFLLGLVSLFLVNPLVAWTNIESQLLLSKGSDENLVDIKQERLWFQLEIQENNAIIRASRLNTGNDNQIHLEDVEILLKDNEGTPLENYCKAKEIIVHDQYLEIPPESQCDLDSALTRSTDIGTETLRVLIKTDISPEDFVALIPLNQTTLWTGIRIAETFEKLGLSVSAHEQRVYLFSLIALPFLLSFMVGLGAGVLPFFEFSGLYKGSFLVFLFGLGIFFLDKVLHSFVINQDFPVLIAALFFPFPVLIALSLIIGVAPLAKFRLPKYEKSFMPFALRWLSLYFLNLIVNYFLFSQFLISEYGALIFAPVSVLLLLVLMPYLENQGKHILKIRSRRFRF